MYNWVTCTPSGSLWPKNPWKHWKHWILVSWKFSPPPPQQGIMKLPLWTDRNDITGVGHHTRSHHTWSFIIRDHFGQFLHVFCGTTIQWLHTFERDLCFFHFIGKGLGHFISKLYSQKGTSFSTRCSVRERRLKLWVCYYLRPLYL